MKNYTVEFDGQKDFFDKFGITPNISNYNDGVYRGNLFEFKLQINDINAVLFQIIKYASKIRIRGEKLPANLILADLNKEIAYIYNSSNFLIDIEKAYFGASSKNNFSYKTDIKPVKINYSSSDGVEKLLSYINSDNFIKYHIDQNNIIGLSIQYYKRKSDKDAFLKGKNAEIRKPEILKDRVIAYTGKDNNEFAKIIDCLNTKLQQRDEGAYYTPKPYVNQMQKMLLKAVSEVPKDMDYIIIDRCAGVGNLEEGLPDNILKHCVLSTLENNEYQVLKHQFGDKCDVIVPNMDALSYDIIPAEIENGKITSDYVREKIEDKNTVVILVENPPFSEAGSGGIQASGQKENKWKKSFVCKEMKKEIKGVGTNELGNLFIWSGFKYYIRTPHDSFILYSPTKYWRCQNLVNKKFKDGFLCNRLHFHTSQKSSVGCIWWKNIDDNKTEKLALTAYDIINDKCEKAKDIEIRKAKHLLSEAYDVRKFKDDVKGIICKSDGTEYVEGKDKQNIRINPVYNKNILGYLDTNSFLIDRKTISLTRTGKFNGNGFYLRDDNFLEKLPLFVAAAYPYEKWYETDVYSKTYDGQGSYIKDRNFIKKCFLYAVLTQKNKCRSFSGSDNRFYKNELCLDGDTLAKKVFNGFENKLTKEERKITKYFDDVLYEAKDTDEYKKIFFTGFGKFKKN